MSAGHDPLRDLSRMLSLLGRLNRMRHDLEDIVRLDMPAELASEGEMAIEAVTAFGVALIRLSEHPEDFGQHRRCLSDLNAAAYQARFA